MYTPVFVAGGELLKQIHVAELDIIVIVQLVFKSGKKTVLIKIIINNLFSKIDIHFLIYNEWNTIWHNSFFTERDVIPDIVTHPEIKIVPICQRRII